MSLYIVYGSYWGDEESVWKRHVGEINEYGVLL